VLRQHIPSGEMIFPDACSKVGGFFARWVAAPQYSVNDLRIAVVDGAGKRAKIASFAIHFQALRVINYGSNDFTKLF
jgi:hypothetical protein